MNYFKAVTFSGKGTAHKVLNDIEDSSYDYLWYDDVAEISVSKKGSTKVHSTWAQDSSSVDAGIGMGALTGGMIGMLFGPGGALAGDAVAGSIGGLIGNHENVKFEDPKLDDFATSLVPDSSALILVGPQNVIGEFATLLGEYINDDFVSYDLALDDAELEVLQNEMAY